jgi:hypothetical protein
MSWESMVGICELGCELDEQFGLGDSWSKGIADLINPAPLHEYVA